MFSEAEAKASQVLAALERGDDPREFNRELRAFVWTLMVRTRALRSQFKSVTERIAESFTARRWDDADTRKALSQRAHQELDRQIQEIISGLPEYRRPWARIVFQQSGMLEAAHRLCDRRMQELDFGKECAQVIDVMRKLDVFETSAKNGQVKGLAQLLREDHLPESFSSVHWQLLEFDADSLILGDSCLVALSQSGEVASLMRLGWDNWQVLYLPISPTKVLFGRRMEQCDTLLADAINRASAELSYAGFYASTNDPRHSNLVEFIGRQNFLVAEHEIETMVTETGIGAAPGKLIP
jgi:hypothetical protein